LDDAIFRLAECVEGSLEKQIESEREAGEAIRKDAVVDVAAAGVIARERRWLLPYLTAATSVLVIEIRKCLAAREPQALREKERKKPGGNALGQVEAEAANQAKRASHSNEEADLTSLNG
jgi:hypothetical protein